MVSGGECPIEKTMALLGTKSAMLILRRPTTAPPGSTTLHAGRHHEGGGLRTAERVGRRRAADAAALPRAGQRAREEYVLTDSGVDFMPVVWAMFEWGRTHLPNRSPLRLAHADCGAEAGVEIRCAARCRRTS